MSVLNSWLEIDFYNVANKANLISKRKVVQPDLIYDTIRCLDYETIMTDKPSVNYVITVIGLMWEHIDHNRYDLRSVVVKFLSRIGYPRTGFLRIRRGEPTSMRKSRLNQNMRLKRLGQNLEA